MLSSWNTLFASLDYFIYSQTFTVVSYLKRFLYSIEQVLLISFVYTLLLVIGARLTHVYYHSSVYFQPGFKWRWLVGTSSRPSILSLASRGLWLRS